MPQKQMYNQPIRFNKTQRQEIDNTLMRLADRTAAPLVMIADISGQLMLYRGRLPAAQSTALAALAAGSFGAGVEMGNFLGLRGKNAFHYQLHEGAAANLYTIAVGDELLLIIAYTPQTTLGLVRIYAQNAQKELLRQVRAAKNVRRSEEEEPDAVIDKEGFGLALNDQLDELFPE